MSEQTNFQYLLRLGPFFQEASGPIIKTVTLILFVLIFNFLIKKMLLLFKNKYKKEEKIWQLSFVSSLYKPLSYFVWFMALFLSLDIIFSNVVNVESLKTALLVNIGAVVALGWFLLRWNKQITLHMLGLSRRKQIGLSPNNLDLISKIATLGIILLVLFLLMEITGRSLQTLIAFGGISGLALAFASQQFISNFFGGLMIYLTQPFSIGEKIFLPEKKIEGEVEEIGWNTTQLIDADKRPTFIPNSIFTQSIVINLSRTTHKYMHFILGLRWQDFASLKTIVEHIKIMLDNHPKIDKLIKPKVFFNSLGEKSLNIEVITYTSSPFEDENEIKQSVLLEIASIIAKEGAEIASSTHVVEIRGHLQLT